MRARRCAAVAGSAPPAAASARPMRTRWRARAVRLGDLASEDTLRAKLTALAAHHNVWLAAAGEPEADPDAMLAGLMAIRDQILPFAGQSWRVLEEARAGSKRVLFEGAQGVMLDIDHGTYPFVTSSNTVAGQAATGAGTGPTNIGFVLESPRPIPPVSAAARSRPRISVMTATGWANAAANSAPSPGASAAAAGSTR